MLCRSRPPDSAALKALGGNEKTCYISVTAPCLGAGGITCLGTFRERQVVAHVLPLRSPFSNRYAELVAVK